MNALTQELFGHDELPHHQPPVQYTGEKFGVEYLYEQSGLQLSLPSKQEEEQEEEDTVDEGIEDERMYLFSSQSVGDEFSEDVSTFAPIYEETEEDEDEEVRIYCTYVGHTMILNY